MRTFQQFKHRDVLFVSLSVNPKARVQSYVDKFKVPWPCGFGATIELMEAFGAVNHMGVGTDEKVIPTLYVIGRDGRICWSDARSRYNHQDVEMTMRNLSAAIEQALSADSPPRQDRRDTHP